MSLELFPARAIIGYVNMNGQKMPVEMSPEFYRALRALVARVGGAASDGMIDTISDVFALGNQPTDSLFLDVVQPAESPVLLPEIVQTSTDNTFANETTYA